MRTPFVSLTGASGADLVEQWGPLLMELRITDERGSEADKLTAVLDDRDGRVVYPQTGAKVTASGGYRESGGVVLNEFVIDQVSLEGWPQRIILQGSSVEAKAASKQRRTETHKATEVPTLGDLADKVAGRNGWTAAVAQDLRSIPITEAIHQAEQSDLACITAFIERHDGMVAVKQGRLVAVRRGEMQSASGAALPPIIIAPGVNLLAYRANWSDRPLYKKVESRYFDRAKAMPEKVEVEVDKEAAGDAVDVLRDPFPTKEEAQRAAEARARELTRGDGSATFEIEGDPTVSAETPVLARGIRAGVDGLWVPTRVEHSWSARGYTSRMETETPGKGDSRSEDA